GPAPTRARARGRLLPARRRRAGDADERARGDGVVLRGSGPATRAVRMRALRLEPRLGLLALEGQLPTAADEGRRSRLGAACALSGPPGRAPRLVLPAELVDADDRVEDRVLPALVLDVGRVLRIEVVEARDDDAHVGRHARPFDRQPVLRAVRRPAELRERVAGRVRVALGVEGVEAVAEDPGRIVGDERVLAAPAGPVP